MKFFKHFTDARNGKSLRGVRRDLGMAGLGAWWNLTEVASAKLEKARNENYTVDHCIFELDVSYLAPELGTKPSQLEKILGVFQAHGLIQFSITNYIVRIEFPKLLESLDRDTDRARPVRGQGAPKNKKQDQEKEPQQVVANSVEELVSKLPDEVHARLRSAFTDPKFLAVQTRACFTYYHAKNPATKPTTDVAWERAIRAWCGRNWVEHQIGSAPDPVAEARRYWLQTARNFIAGAAAYRLTPQLLEAPWVPVIEAAGGWDSISRLSQSDDDVHALAKKLSEVWAEVYAEVPA